MPVKYNVVERGNQLNKGEEPKFYASAKADGEVSFRNLAKEISDSSTTVSDTDVLAVLNELSKALRKHLEEGRVVKCDGLGSFQITLTSDGAKTADDFNSSYINGSKIQFRPSSELRDMLKSLKYEKYKK